MKSLPFARRGLDVIGLVLALGSGSVSSAMAVPVFTEDAAAATVLASGFSRVAKAESTQGHAWDVWASKDGIAYVITIDAGTGQVLIMAPAVADD